MDNPQPLRLHLGCGDVHLDGYVNIDSRYQPGVDRVDNIGILKRYEPNSVAEIYACHCLDHFTRWEYPRVLKRWHEILKPQGVLKLSVVDFSELCRQYENGWTCIPEMIGLLVAAQDYKGNVRHMHWDIETISGDLQDAGFTNISMNSEPFHSNDCSAVQLNGNLISLNVEAIKP